VAQKVSEIMTPAPVALRSAQPVEDGHPVGILSIGDMALERDERSALADISAQPPNR
jgi:hypothetical protein